MTQEWKDARAAAKSTLQDVGDAFARLGNSIAAGIASAMTLAGVVTLVGPGRRANKGSNPSRYARLRKRSRK